MFRRPAPGPITKPASKHPHSALHGAGYNPPAARPAVAESVIYDRAVPAGEDLQPPKNSVSDERSGDDSSGISGSGPPADVPTVENAPSSGGEDNYVTDEISVPSGTGIGTPGKVKVIHHGYNGVKSVTYVSPKVLKTIIAPSSYGFGSKPPPGMPPGTVVHHFHPPTLTVHEHPSSAALLPGSAPAPSLPPRRYKKKKGGKGKRKQKRSRISGWFRRTSAQ